MSFKLGLYWYNAKTSYLCRLSKACSMLKPATCVVQVGLVLVQGGNQLGIELRGESIRPRPLRKQSVQCSKTFHRIIKIIFEISRKCLTGIFSPTISCSAHPHNIINLIWGKNINQEGGGGGQKIILKFNIHPWLIPT